MNDLIKENFLWKYFKKGWWSIALIFGISFLVGFLSYFIEPMTYTNTLNNGNIFWNICWGSLVVATSSAMVIANILSTFSNYNPPFSFTIFLVISADITVLSILSIFSGIFREFLASRIKSKFWRRFLSTILILIFIIIVLTISYILAVTYPFNLDGMRSPVL